jgi:chaperone LolA
LYRIVIQAAAVALLAAASAAADDSGRELVDGFVNDVDTLSSRFEQSLLDAGGELLETSAGTLEISRPGRFRWAYDEPYEQWLVADGLNIWSYDVDLAQVTVKPQAGALANTPAMLLGGSVEALDEFEFQGSYDDAGLTWVRMAPVDTDSGFHRVDLGFADRMLVRMVFRDNLEQTTIVSLFDVVVNEAIDGSRFVFEVPADVDVVGRPASVRANMP